MAAVLGNSGPNYGSGLSSPDPRRRAWRFDRGLSPASVFGRYPAGDPVCARLGVMGKCAGIDRQRWRDRRKPRGLCPRLCAAGEPLFPSTAGFWMKISRSCILTRWPGSRIFPGSIVQGRYDMICPPVSAHTAGADVAEVTPDVDWCARGMRCRNRGSAQNWSARWT